MTDPQPVAGSADGPAASLPPWQRLLVVVAHPDDESFGLGALIDAFVAQGAVVDVLCFTQGEASTLGASADLASIRAAELQQAAEVLGVRQALLRDHPDGGLSTVPAKGLDRDVINSARAMQAEGLLVFDPAGITGHPDHIAATASAVRSAQTLGLPVLAWTLEDHVARQLRDETGAPFTVSDPDSALIRIQVDRRVQRAAIVCHATQATPGSVLWRRLDLQGDTEAVRRLPLDQPSEDQG